VLKWISSSDEQNDFYTLYGSVDGSNKIAFSIKHLQLDDNRQVKELWTNQIYTNLAEESIIMITKRTEEPGMFGPFLYNAADGIVYQKRMYLFSQNKEQGISFDHRGEREEGESF